MNKLVDKWNNTYHRSIGKEPIDADYSALAKEIEMNPKVPKFKSGDRVRMVDTKVFLAKITPKIGQDKYLLLILWWKLIFGRIKLKI